MEWYTNGSATEYLKEDPDANRKALVCLVFYRNENVLVLTCLIQVCDIARGLKYLHYDANPHIVHGDLKGVSKGNSFCNNTFSYRVPRRIMS